MGGVISVFGKRLYSKIFVAVLKRALYKVKRYKSRDSYINSLLYLHCLGMILVNKQRKGKYGLDILVSLHIC